MSFEQRGQLGSEALVSQPVLRFAGIWLQLVQYEMSLTFSPTSPSLSKSAMKVRCVGNTARRRTRRFENLPKTPTSIKVVSRAHHARECFVDCAALDYTEELTSFA